MRKSLMVAALVASLVMASAPAPADAAALRLFDPHPDTSHANIAHYDYGTWLAGNSARKYGDSMPLYVMPYACAQAGVPNDPACNNLWNSWVGLAVGHWSDALETFSGPNLKPTLVVPNLSLSPCSNDQHAQWLGDGYGIAVCVEPSFDDNDGRFDPNIFWSGGAWHMRGGVMRIGNATTVESFWNLLAHELGHGLAVGHRGNYGYVDPYSTNYQVVDGSPGSVMDYNDVNQYRYPDYTDFVHSVYLNGGYVTGHCYNLHLPAACPGINDQS